METEKRKRINIALWAYAYEIMNDSMVSDATFDKICLEINPKSQTDNPIMDKFFNTEFSPDTGMWIHKHPQLSGIINIYQRLTGKKGIFPESSINKNVPIVKSAAQAAMDAGFKTYSQMKIYLAALGFRVINDSQLIGGRWFDFEYDVDFVHVTDTLSKTRKSIAYNELLGC